MMNGNYRIEKMEITHRENNTVYGIALGNNENSKIWVTWGFRANLNDKDTDFFWGHYYEREKDAIIDYHKRIIDEL